MLPRSPASARFALRIAGAGGSVAGVDLANASARSGRAGLAARSGRSGQMRLHARDRAHARPRGADHGYEPAVQGEEVRCLHTLIRSVLAEARQLTEFIVKQTTPKLESAGDKYTQL